MVTRQFVFSIILLISFVLESVHAQIVSNVRSEQIGNLIFVRYDLQASAPCEVSLFVSMNGGNNWIGPLTYVSGSIGENVNAGSNTIQFNVLEEFEEFSGSGISFKVIANKEMTFEPEMIFVSGGNFLMGRNDGEAWEKPIHQVTLQDYYIGKFEVTQAQWESIMGYNPSCSSLCNNCPVDNVKHSETIEFIEKINSITGEKYRLPTEAEWEFAANGGAKSKNFKYSGSSNLNDVAWWAKNSNSTSHPVGTKKANELGIFDMTGNVMEWCGDFVISDNGYYPPTKEELESFKRFEKCEGCQQYIYRGGSFESIIYSPDPFRNTARFWNGGEITGCHMGFRLALDKTD